MVGYLTPDTKHISNPEQLIITDEVEAVTREAARLHQQVNIVLAKILKAACLAVDLYLYGQSFQFHVYLQCLNACLAYNIMS